MKRSKVLIPLSQDHHRGLLLAALIKKDAPKYEALPNDLEGKILYTQKAWNEELSIHFKNEEEILFPFVKGKDKEIDTLIDVLLQEHRQIQNKINDLKTNVNSTNTLNELSELLENHIRKEERQLFAKIQDVIPESVLQQIEGKIEPVK